MSDVQPQSYQNLMAKPRPAGATRSRSVEQELDGLLSAMKERHAVGDADAAPDDPLTQLRKLMVEELIPVFVKLVEKYQDAGISMQMDASNFLEGGREIKFEFSHGEYRAQLHGTVTSEAIAFHETRYSPEFHGELTTGPMLRLRQLTGATFRDFVCSRLTTLLRQSMRRR